MWKLHQHQAIQLRTYPAPSEGNVLNWYTKMISPSPQQANLLYSQSKTIKLNFNKTHSTYKHCMLPLVVIELFLDLNASL